MTDLIPGVEEAKLAAKVGGVLVKVLPWIAGAGLLLAAGAYADRHAPFIGAQPTIDRLSASLGVEKTAFTQEHAAFLAEQVHSARLEAARGQDHTSAVTGASDAERACSARVSAARKSAASIVQILNEPPHANPDPAEPELLDAGQLRSANGR